MVGSRRTVAPGRWRHVCLMLSALVCSAIPGAQAADLQVEDKKVEDQVERHLQTAVQYVNAGDYQQALASMQKALTLDPDNLKANSGMGNIYAALHQYDHAISYLERTLKLDPRDLTALYGLGACYMELQQHEKAIPYLEKLIRLRPNDPKPLETLAVAYVRRGVTYGRQGQSQKAKSSIQGAIVLFRRTGNAERVKELTALLKQIPQPPALQEPPVQPSAPAQQPNQPPGPQRPPQPNQPPGPLSGQTPNQQQ